MPPSKRRRLARSRPEGRKNARAKWSRGGMEAGQGGEGAVRSPEGLGVSPQAVTEDGEWSREWDVAAVRLTHMPVVAATLGLHAQLADQLAERRWRAGGDRLTATHLHTQRRLPGRRAGDIHLFPSHTTRVSMMSSP